MNFKNTNSLNNRMNLLSGNLLPIAGGDSAFPLIWQAYNIVVWLIELIHTIALVAGSALVPPEKALNDATVCVVVTVEAFIMFMRLHTRRKVLRRVVGQLNDILSDADETMRDIVKSTLNSTMKLFTIYGFVGATTIIVWTVQPATLALNRDTFFYVDYNLPCAFSTEPFSRSVLILSSVFMTIGSTLIFFKRFGLDVYIIHLVLMLTVQYRYMAEKLILSFRDLQKNDRVDKMLDVGTNRRTKKELRTLCRHHNTVLRISLMLREVLSVNFSLLYVNSVCRFCFIGVLMSTVPSLTLVEAMSITLFSLGSVTQFFLVCSSVQTLSDASTEITDKAFDEDWHRYGLSIKRTFLLLIMANNLECKIAAVGKFNLSLPSFMTIMNQSYSIALLLLRTN